MEPKIGDQKNIDGEEYVWLELIPGHPTWHSEQELAEFKNQFTQDGESPEPGNTSEPDTLSRVVSRAVMQHKKDHPDPGTDQTPAIPQLNGQAN